MVNVIFGKDRFLVQKEIDRLEKKVSEDYGVFEKLSFSASDSQFQIDDVYESVMTLSLFNERKFVVLLIESDKEMKQVDEGKLIEMLEMSPFEVNLVLWFGKKPLAKTALRKMIDKHAEISDIKKLDNQTFGSIMKHKMSALGIQMQSSAFNLFLKRVNGDLLRAEVELDKMSVLDGPITLDHVEQLVSESFDDEQFALTNALMDRNLKESLNVYHRLLEAKIYPLALLGMVASSLRGVYQVMILRGDGYQAAEIAEISGMSYKQVQYVMRTQRRNPSDVLQLLNDLAEIDQRAKLGLIDRHLSFELFMLRLK